VNPRFDVTAGTAYGSTRAITSRDMGPPQTPEHILGTIR
jgi:hypothetical protein